MSVKFSLKNTFFVFLGGLVCAVAAAFLVNFIFAGPRLGPHYDFLLTLRKPPPVSQEILILNTDEFVESSDIFSVLITLTEMESANLIFADRVSPSASGVIITESEIRSRFIDEYILLGTNIRNLFEAIRSGSVSPVQAPVYVERLVELTEQGRDRLLSALVDRDEDLLRAISVFGNFLEADTKPQLDKDGKLRRVRPVDFETFAEHPVFLSLKNRYAVTQIETTDIDQFLWFRRYDGTEFDIPLDRYGNIITPWNCAFRSIDITLFREYDEADRSMRSALVHAGELGAFSQILPEQSPLYIGDYALMLKEEMLKSANVENRVQWIKMRNNYFKSLDVFLNGPSEMILVNGYDEVIADETSLNENTLAALSNMRDELSRSFYVMRNEFKKLDSIRTKLEEELAMSFCIMGHDVNAQYPALLANALITGTHIMPVYDNYVFLFSIATSFIVLLIIFMMQPALELIIGSILSILAGSAFGGVFVFYSFWIEPFVVICSSLTGTLVIFFCKRAIIKYRSRLFRQAYGTAVSKNTLKKLICSGRPRLSDVVVSPAAVIAIKDINLLKMEDNEKPQDAGGLKKKFYSSVKSAVLDAGAVIAGYEGDTILACFGSPLNNCENHILKMCAFVKELLDSEKISWRFGIDAGECTFYWSPETGYSVNGSPAVRAKTLVSKTARLQVRAIMTGAIREKINVEAKKIDSLYDGSESIYDFSSCAFSKTGF